MFNVTFATHPVEGKGQGNITAEEARNGGDGGRCVFRQDTHR